MILNYSLFSVHRKIQYYMDDVNFRIDQKSFSSIYYGLMYFQFSTPEYRYIKTLALEEKQEGQGLTYFTCYQGTALCIWHSASRTRQTL